MRVKAPAKLNLYLEVLGKRPDGYHEIRTIMQAVSLFDELTFQPREDGRIVLHATAGEDLPPPEENLVVRAARLLQEESGCHRGAEIHLVKRIPVGSGLGGGSSDCAATLRTLGRLWGLGLSVETLETMAARLGSDAAFFVRGGAALCEGRGERVTPLPAGGVFHYVLVVPRERVSTARLYAALEGSAGSLTNGGGSSSIEDVRAALGAGDPALLGAVFHNALQEPAFRLAPQARRVREVFACAALPLRCRGLSLSGSGSALFGVFEGPEWAEAARRQIAARLDLPVLAVHSLSAVSDAL